jgi:putative aldouronate transport system permease protein
LEDNEKHKQKSGRLRKEIRRARPVYLMLLPVIVYFLIFYYWPMYWLRMSFYDYSLYRGFDGSTFVGLANFRTFFTGWISGN